MQYLDSCHHYICCDLNFQLSCNTQSVHSRVILESKAAEMEEAKAAAMVAVKMVAETESEMVVDSVVEDLVEDLEVDLEVVDSVAEDLVAVDSVVEDLVGDLAMEDSVVLLVEKVAGVMGVEKTYPFWTP